MSQYLHEIVLQEFVIENFSKWNLTIPQKINGNSNSLIVTNIRKNANGTFWDLEAQCDNGTWVPMEIEWISDNFKLHGHHNDIQFRIFKERNGVLLSLRANKLVSGINQCSILDIMTESILRNSFKKWFRKKSMQYLDSTIQEFLTGNYTRVFERIILFKVNKIAGAALYQENGVDLYCSPGNRCYIGFTDRAHKSSSLVREIQGNDVILMLKATCKRETRAKFVDRISKQTLKYDNIAAYRVISRIMVKNEAGLNSLFWPQEITNNKVIYEYVCEVEPTPFFGRTNGTFPFVKSYSDATWECYRRCMQYNEYWDITSREFVSLASHL